MTQNTDDYVRHCLSIIESKFNRGNSSVWTNYDFEVLSSAIFSSTSVRLSVTTLKRIWGKLKYESAPTLTTLNALARFAGYEDWRSFEQTETKIELPLPSPPAPNTSNPLNQGKPRNRRLYWLMGVPVLAIGLFFFISAKQSKHPPFDPAQFEFTTNKMITEGVPNSVIFNYDVSKVKADSVFIVQTWDARRKTLVPKDKHAHSAIYYYPGFFRTQLIVDGQTVRTHDLWITSDGWLALLEDTPMPLYFKKHDYVKNDRVEIDQSTLTAYLEADTPKPPRIRFFNQQDMGDLTNDNFTFETTIKNDFNKGKNTCHYTEVLIQCKNDIIIIPLTARPCVGDLTLYFCGTRVTSTDADLSGFGCDLTQWTKLRVETINKKASIFINDKMAWSLDFPNDPTGIVGVQYRFNGAGAVKNTSFKSKGKIYDLGLK